MKFKPEILYLRKKVVAEFLDKDVEILNINTNRIKSKVCKGRIAAQLLNKSQELFVLALLKYISPDKYGDVTQSDRPDLQGKSIGIEVTCADPPEDIQSDQEFAKYCKDHDERRKNTIYNLSNKTIQTIGGIDALMGGGGYNFYDKDALIKCIEKKIEKAQNYPTNYERLELAIVRRDRPLQAWIQSLNAWIKPFFHAKNPFMTIYIIFPNSYFVITKDSDGEVFDLDPEEYQNLKTIGRMTAEGEINLDAEEWN